MLRKNWEHDLWLRADSRCAGADEAQPNEIVSKR